MMQQGSPGTRPSGLPVPRRPVNAPVSRPRNRHRLRDRDEARIARRDGVAGGEIVPAKQATRLLDAVQARRP